jgi:hypothetical protein
MLEKLLRNIYTEKKNDMSKMKGYLAAMMAMSMMTGSMPIVIKEDESPERIKKRINLNKTIRQIKRGMKEFEIDGYKVHALNYKNALRKIDRLKKGK